MIKVEKIDVWGFEHAIRGMRNPMNSWDKSDSHFIVTGIHGTPEVQARIGKNDLDLMRRLYKAGPEHRKYLRQIFVSMDITAPLYWWKEMDQYRINVTTNSCSTMHKIAAKEFELGDFSWDQLLNTGCTLFERKYPVGEFVYSTEIQPLQFLTDYIIPSLNTCREKYIETKEKKYWWQLIQLLPSSYNQKRTVTFTYENVVSMIKQRTGHKLTEWEDFVALLRGLPYVEEIIDGSET